MRFFAAIFIQLAFQVVQIAENMVSLRVFYMASTRIGIARHREWHLLTGVAIR